MAKKIMDTNPYLRTRANRTDRIARSALASARMDGMEITPKEIRQMASKVAGQYSAGKK